MFNYNTKSGPTQEVSAILSILNDKKREQDKMSGHIVKAMQRTDHTSNDKENRVRECGSFISIRTDGSIQGANFCRNKLCPLCQWRMSRKTFGKMVRAQDIVEKENDKLNFIFVTFTLRNMKSLSEGVQQILLGFNNLTHDRTFRKLCKGFYRRMEVTYNENKNTWHPHIHMIVAVEPEYFTKLYLRKAGWAQLWKRNARIDYIPVVDVRKVSDDRMKAVAEIAKYTLKPFDINRASEGAESILSELLQATHNRRLSSYGGVYKRAVKAVGLSEDMPLTDVSEVESFERFIFVNGEYKLFDSYKKGVG